MPAPTSYIRAQEDHLVVGADATPVRLIGVNFPAYGWGRADCPRQAIMKARNFRDADYRRVAALGMNVVRLNLAYHLIERADYPFHYHADGWEWLDAQIARARAAGVYLILDMHAPQGGYQAPDYTGDFWDNPEPRARLKALWVEIARRYRTETQVAAFSLLNEPCTRGRNDLWVTYAQEVVNAIRTVDAQHLIVVEQDVAAMIPFVLDDSNLLYEFHCYEPWRYAAQFWRYGFQGRYGDPRTPILPWTWVEGDVCSERFTVADARIAGLMPLLTGEVAGASFEVIERDGDGAEAVLMRVRVTPAQTPPAGTTPVADDPLPIAAGLWAPTTASWRKCERLAFPVRQGCTYVICGAVPGVQRGGLALTPLMYKPGDEFAPLIRTTIEARLLHEYGLAFYREHGAPVNIGEYGVSPHAFKRDRGGAQWLADRLDLYAQYGLSAQYWVYSGAADFALYDNRNHYPAPHHANTQALAVFQEWLN